MPNLFAFYDWQGVDKEGLNLKGQIRAPNAYVAKAQLLSFGIDIQKIHKNIFSFRIKKILTPQSQIHFSEQLSELIASGMSIPKALHALEKAFSNIRIKTLFWFIKYYIELGQSFGQVLHLFPQEFSLIYRQFVDIGEESGQLEKTLLQLADLEKKKILMRNKFKKASFYPVLVLSLALLIISFLMIVIVPKFLDIFNQSKISLPPATLFLVNTSHFLSEHMVSMSLISFGIFALHAYFFHTSITIKKMTLHYLLLTPWMGKIILSFFIGRFSYGLSTLLQVGISLTQALEILLKNADNLLYEEEIRKILHLVNQGNALSQSLKASFLFPAFFIYTTKIGEESGLLATSLLKVAHFYERKIDAFIDSISIFLEPILMVVLGLIIGAFMLALYLPIFSLGNAM